MYLVSLKQLVTLSGSISLSGTFFCVTKQTLSFPRTPMAVRPAVLTALNAYSVTWDERDSGAHVRNFSNS